ncbi:DNA-directed RNA polymerase subunit L [Candidatus Woesearchaeota archaeon]|nr:MAG: DNA-directed RNA polymerase subunit L [Candidatus Woesearchaeota archaeon]
MEVKFVEEGKNRIVFELFGEGHTLSNLLRKELWQDSHVKVATYAIEHPLVEKPHFIVETDGADPKKTVISAISRLRKVAQTLKTEAKKLK